MESIYKLNVKKEMRKNNKDMKFMKYIEIETIKENQIIYS